MEMKMSDFQKLINLNPNERKDFLVWEKDFKLITWEPKWNEYGHYFDLKSNALLPIENSSEKETISFTFPNTFYEINEIYLPRYDDEERSQKYKFDRQLMGDIEKFRKGEKVYRHDFLRMGGKMSDKRYNDMKDEMLKSEFIEDENISEEILKSVYQHDFAIFKSDETVWYNSPTEGYANIEFNVLSKPLSMVTQFTRNNEHVITQNNLLRGKHRYFIYSID